MARYDHLKLVRLPERLERRKTGGGGPPPARDRATHPGKVREQLDQAIEVQRQRRKPEMVDPSLILRVSMTGASMEEEWAKLGLTVVSSDMDKSLILFSSREEMDQLIARIDAYSGEIPKGQKNPSYQGFIHAIDSIGVVQPKDRVGPRFQEDGFAEIADFVADEMYWVDIEVWQIGRREARERKLNQIEDYIIAKSGEVTDRYVGPSLTVARAHISGALLVSLLKIEEIATIDLPPQPDFETEEALEMELGGMPVPNSLPDDAPIIGIIDSGINDHPMLADILVGSIAVPATLGTADDFGHGTRVGSIAAFGDIRAQINAGTMNPGARLCSAKVVNGNGQFDNRRLVPTQMRDAITGLNEQFDCRIFVISLGDRKLPYKGGKVGIWAATLDELARELDVVIFVSSGNRRPRSGNRVEEGITDYPLYLMEDSNRFFEPAGAMNVMTVGSISHGEGIDGNLAAFPNVRAITREGEPSPFSRIGPGMAGSIKPDLVEVGGTMVYDATVMRLRQGDDLPSAGVLALHHAYLGSGPIKIWDSHRQ
ncbi:S8 family peptidase [Pararhizobium sp. IMCC21322]|uniref:S8 family peptidase n=1 Tax=Pararhizobium sp. IMCC21322 TaxID=3067903 RepID=UPI002740B675|nr:S8 family peptidase [Pararhizobium sp. IMCC21322]